MSSNKTKPEGSLLRNKRAYHDYTIEDTLETGIVLHGSEVKALRQGHAQLSDAYAMIQEGELFLQQLKISPYAWANQFNHTPERTRKLLVHKKQIEKLAQASEQRGYTLLPLEIYSKAGKIKILIGVCKGKKQYDKRSEEKEKEAQRELDKALRGKR